MKTLVTLLSVIVIFVSAAFGGDDVNYAPTAAAQEAARIKAVIAGGIKLGMRAAECEAIWGKPLHINVDVDSGGLRQQWVYDRGYLYLDNGVLKTIQYRNVATSTPAPAAPQATPRLIGGRSW